MEKSSEPSQHPLLPLEEASAKDTLWDLFCIASVAGIWPRFIEPRLIFTTKLTLPVPHLPEDLMGFKILQFSDLHLNSNMSDAFLKRLSKTISSFKPDLIVFTGDFLCYSAMVNHERLASFLCTLSAPYGCYAIFGNHDYASFVSINNDGEYDCIEDSSSSLGRAFKRLFKTISLKKSITERAKAVPMHFSLMELLKGTPFILLHNDSTIVKVRRSVLNICGFGEYMLGRFQPEGAFKNYDLKGPGLLLLHNPDAAPLLSGYPGDIVLCGHTHGGQVNLPWMWKKFTLLEDMRFKKGLFNINGKWVYVNRGIGSVLPFRWFSPPELLLLTLENAI